MRVGITFDLKQETPPQSPPSVGGDAGGVELPDDVQEEFDSPATIAAIAGVLRDLGHEVIPLGDGRELLQRLLADPPDFVFNIAEGQGVGRSREARVPAVLEMLGIPYTGSDPLTLAVTLDKDCAKRLVQSVGVKVPQGFVVHPEDDPRAHLYPFPQFDTWPKIVKPAWEGSSKGIRAKSVVEGVEELLAEVDSLRRDHRQPILVEEFIEGDEVTVGVLGNKHPRILGIMRVLPTQPTDRFIYGLEVKRDWQRLVRYEVPAKLPPNSIERIEKAALDSYRVLGCRDVARVDFRLRDGVPYFLEANPLPGINPESGDLVIMSKAIGWTYSQLVGTIFEAARKRYELASRGC